MKEYTAIAEIRDFNRFYTNIIAVLDQDVLRSGFSLAEARILFEVKSMQPCSAREIMKVIHIDEGYLSRILKKFVAKGYLLKVRSAADQRTYYLKLSVLGTEQMTHLEQVADASTLNLIQKLTVSQIKELLENMQNIKKLLK